MKKIVLIFLTFLSLSVFGQIDVKDGSFKKIEGYVMLDKYEHTDMNNAPMALIKISTENITSEQRRKFTFKGNFATCFDVYFEPEEIYLYITADAATFIEIIHDDYGKTEYYLPVDLCEFCGYEMVVKYVPHISQTETQNFASPHNEYMLAFVQEINGHEYVDLGLSVKWATCNVGANKPEDYGNYYAWGETKTKYDYSSSNSVTYGKNYSDIGGESQYDAARSNWGGTWRLPTEAELEELVNKCNWQWTTQNGVKGYKVMGPNGNSIFLPAAGYRYESSLYYAGEDGLYWSSTPYERSSGIAYPFWSFWGDEDDDDFAYDLNFDSGRQRMYGSGRNYGLSVRPVSE